MPKEYRAAMQELLGAAYPEFEACMTRPPLRGLRVNTLKFDLGHAAALGLPLTPAPFTPEGFYLDTADGGVGNSPWHHAGAFYMQEPSAMSAVALLAPQPGERVLDLCAAPGGKSGQIAAALRGRGLLWSNEYVRRRAQVLLANLERLGVRNAVVSNTHPALLAARLGGFFDRVLVDAPCSGEGMFRRDPAAVAEWSPSHAAACAVRQRSILDSAAACVRPGGVLVYSTCTFSVGENEDTVAAFLDAHPDFELLDSDVNFGRPGFDRSDRYDLTRCRRVLPMDGGEGHFAAKFARLGDEPAPPASASSHAHKPTEGEKQAAELYAQCFTAPPYGDIRQIGDDCYLLPSSLPDTRGLGVLRGGVKLGECLRGRVEPAHALFMASRPAECRRCLTLSPDDPLLTRFLRGEGIPAAPDARGYAAVACGTDDVRAVTGFGKCSGGMCKNKYPKGLRLC